MLLLVCYYLFFLVVYYLFLETFEKVLKEVARVLRPGGVFLLDLTDGAYVAKNYTPYTWEWIGEDLFVCRQVSGFFGIVSRCLTLKPVRSVRSKMTCCVRAK